jgi:hypothetical protein
MFSPAYCCFVTGFSPAYCCLVQRIAHCLVLSPAYSGTVGPVHTIHYDDGVYDENLTKAHILKSILSRDTLFTFPYFT